MRRAYEGNEVSSRDDTLAGLETAAQAVSSQTYEDITEQSRKVAANILASYGDKYVLNAQGFILACQKIHEAALLWLMSEGYVELTDKAKVTEDELAKRRDAKLGTDEDVEDRREIGNYL